MSVGRKARQKPDLRLAESYIPAVVTWIKGLAYTCIVPVVVYGGGERRIWRGGAFVLALYMDHMYVSPGRGFLDSTAVAADITAGCIALMLLQMEGCLLCQVGAGSWAALGALHVAVPDGWRSNALGTTGRQSGGVVVHP